MIRTNSVVMSIPPDWAEDLEKAVPGISRTASAMQDLFSSARRSLKVLAPYVDPTFAGLVSAVSVPVKVVTTPAPGRPARPNPVLERCSTMCDLAVRYLNERRERALIFQMHAKMILADGERAYVGSANLTDTSVHYNCELGLCVDDPKTISSLERVFDYVFDRLAVRASQL